MGMVGDTQMEPPSVVRRWLDLRLGTSGFGAWLADRGTPDEPDYVGAACVELVNRPRRMAYLAALETQPGSRALGPLLAAVEQWCRDHRVTPMVYYARRSPVTLIQKYHFTAVHTVLQKEIDDGSPQ